MPPDPKRKRYTWFDDYRRWEYEDLSDDDYNEEDFEEEHPNRPANLREIEVQKAVRMINRIRDVYDPLIDIIECYKTIIVAAELHGVKGVDIILKIVGQALTIGFRSGEARNIKILKLPKPVDPHPIQSLYKNGILLVEFKKRGRPAGETIIPISNIQ